MAAFSQWIRRVLAADPPRAKSLVVTVFGDAILPATESIWLASLIALMAPFGVNERLVRSSVFRLVQDGWLRAERRGRSSLYRFSQEGRARLSRAHAHIYRLPRPRRWNGDWTLVVAPPPLRRQLHWEGFRSVFPGVYGHPAVGPMPVLPDNVLAFCARGDALSRFAATAWDLRPVAAEYTTFIRRFQPLLRIRLQDPVEAFAARILAVHAYRRAFLHDPLLPREMLPHRWPGAPAYHLWRRLYAHATPATNRHLRALLRHPLA